MKNLIQIAFSGVVSLFACNGSNDNIRLTNDEASLPPSFNFRKLDLKVMASFSNQRSGTMSILYANPIALINARKGNSQHSAGEVMALLTWKQHADDHWFGAKIPGALQSAEIVKIRHERTAPLIDYQKFSGKDLLADPGTTDQKERIIYILRLQPSVAP